MARILADHTYWPVYEYYPPKRVEAWLTLPPGVVPRRDLIESGELEDYEWDIADRPYGWLGPEPEENYATVLRFRKEFGNEAAWNWELPVPASFTMRKIWGSKRLQEQFYDETPLPFKLGGRIAKIPIHINLEPPVPGRPRDPGTPRP